MATAIGTTARSRSTAQRVVDADHRRARRRRAGIIFAVLLLIATGLGIDYFTSRGGGVAQTAFVQPIEHSLRSLFARRSPGDRTVAQLLKARSAYLSERTAAMVDEPTPTSLFLSELNADDEPVDLDAPLSMVSTPFEEALLEVPPPDGPTPNFAAGIRLDGPGFSGLSPGVPEPSTWLTMLFGFGVTGLALRRRRRARGVGHC